MTPFAFAFAIPLFTLARIIANSNWLNTPAICKKASLIGSACPSRQSSVILPTITRRRLLDFTNSIISHNCFVLLASRGTSKEMIGFLGAGNNHMVGMTVAVAVAVEQALK